MNRATTHIVIREDRSQYNVSPDKAKEEWNRWLMVTEADSSAHQIRSGCSLDFANDSVFPQKRATSGPEVLPYADGHGSQKKSRGQSDSACGPPFSATHSLSLSFGMSAKREREREIETPRQNINSHGPKKRTCRTLRDEAFRIFWREKKTNHVMPNKCLRKSSMMCNHVKRDALVKKQQRSRTPSVPHVDHEDNRGTFQHCEGPAVFPPFPQHHAQYVFTVGGSDASESQRHVRVSMYARESAELLLAAVLRVH